MDTPHAAAVLAEWPHTFHPGTGAVIVALHGTGSSDVEIAALAEELAPGAAILAPRGRVSENGAGRWFRRASEGVFDVDDVIHRSGELAGFLRWASTEYGLGALPVIVTGFSNGANMALALGALYPQLAPSVVAFSGMYPFGDRPLPLDLGSSSILLLNGTTDPMAPQSSVERLAGQVTARGAHLTRMSRDGGHGITTDELAQARQWIRDLATAPHHEGERRTN